MVDLQSLKDRAKFEDLCTMLFRKRLALLDGSKAYRLPNLRGVECEPVTIGDRVYSFQAKYFDDQTRLRERKPEFIESIRVARQMGVTDLVLFVNKDKSVNSHGEQPNESPKYMEEIDREARGDSSNPEVRLEWWFKTGIEDALGSEEYRGIRNMFFESRFVDYYVYVCGRFDDDKGSELYGRIPLRECYIEPMITEGYGQFRSVRDYIESWVHKNNSHDNDHSRIAVICGEPGHGKTSLCRKAVWDFRKVGWLAGMVSNVLYFSLNPANTSALAPGQFDFYSLLSWGNDRKSNKHRFEEEDCEGALVFLDGFDELLEWNPGFDLGSFINDCVARFQRDTKSHVIITSRNMAVDPDKDAYILGRRVRVPILRMQPISRERQLAWIELCADYYRYVLTDDSSQVKPGAKDAALKAIDELSVYLSNYQRLHDDTLQDVLGVPIIFRMVVAARYIPKDSEPIVRIYDDLFDVTWKRHMHRQGSQSMDKAKSELSRHALRVYMDDADAATVDDVLESAWWLFSFYTTHEKHMRVGFLHRSFYQYFLAHEIVSWFEQYALDENKYFLQAQLSHLARRRLDKTTLGYTRDIYNGYPNRNTMDKSFAAAYEIPKDDFNRYNLDQTFAITYQILRETDGILSLPSDSRYAVNIMTIPPLQRANNVFWNIVSICSICGYRMATNRVNTTTMQAYDLAECVLTELKLEKTDLRNVRLAGTNLKKADLRGADLRGADLRGADLRGADLQDADLRCADFAGADLSGANLRRADLRGADLRGARLEEVHLWGADLRREDLEGVNLDGANLRKANLEGSNLRRAHLWGAHLWGANLVRADLRGAYLKGANLRGAVLRGADLKEAEFFGAHLEGALLREADLRGTHFWGTNLAETDLKDEDLEKGLLAIISYHL